MNAYRLLIVDDEPAARRGLKRRLEAFAPFGNIDLCANGKEAITALQQSAYDLVFLDIQMPEIDGFDVVEQLGEAMPPVVFVTAYDAFAIRAFEIHALDYLLKPLNQARFEAAMNRIFELLEHKQMHLLQSKIQTLLGDCRTMIASQTPESSAEKLMVRDQGRYFFIPVESMIFCQVEGNYVQIQTDDKAYWIRETLANLQAKLGSQRFLRIARPLLVHKQHIREIHPYTKGAYLLKLTGGFELKSSRHYQLQLKEFLSQHRRL